jgi:hypothetical protein
MSLLSKVSRKVKPNEVINYFRRNLLGSGELGRKEINQIKGKLKNLSQEDKERLRTADLEDLTPEEVDLVMFGFVGFKDFGMPNKTLAEMKGDEFTKFKNKLNKMVDDVLAGKTESVEEFYLEDGEIKSRMVEKTKKLPKGEPSQLTLFNEGGVISSLLSDKRIKFSKGSRFALKALKDILGEGFEFGAKIKPLTKSEAKQKVSAFLKISKELQKAQDLAYEQGLIAEADGNQALASKYSYLFGKLDDKLGEIDIERLRLEEFIKTGKRPKFNEGGETSMLKPDFIDIDGDGNKTESMKTAAKQAKERDGMAIGGISRAVSSLVKKLFKKKSSSKQERLEELIESYKETFRMEDESILGAAPNDETISNRREEIQSKINILLADMDDVFDSRIEDATGYDRYNYVNDRLMEGRDGMAHGGEPLPNKGLEELHKEKPDVVAKMLREQKQEGGNMDMQMSMLMDKPEPEKEMSPETPMESDEEMEDNYLDFIIDEALSEEEEDMLMSKLQEDEQLSMLFDKVIEVASEFAGSGPVEGPGSGVSDSIPARLSDGEFVFTAKSVKEIGADNLMAMMKDAEANADARQGMQNGGDVEEETVTLEPDQEPARQEIRVVKETVDSPNRMIADEDEISKSIKSNMMLDPMQRHVRS